jgi:hypothetical protein
VWPAPWQINPLNDPTHPLHNVILSERHKETFPPYTPCKSPFKRSEMWAPVDSLHR